MSSLREIKVLSSRQPHPTWAFHSRFAATALTLTSCAPHAAAPDASSDRVQYTQAVAPSTGTPESRLSRCAAIADVQLRGDCSLAITQSVGIRGVDHARAWCPRAEVGIWKDECFFASAESAGMRGDLSGATELCGLSGTYESECRFHLFQLVSQTSALNAPNDALTAEQTLEALLSQYGLPNDTPGSPTTRRAWYCTILKRHGVRSLEWCAPLSDLHRPDCDAAARETMRTLPAQAAP